MNILEKAINKIDRQTLDNMYNGEAVKLNKRYELYKYFDSDYFVLRDTVIDEEIFTVQYLNQDDKNNDELVFTDFYGYDEIEETL
jgi:hypothetical protein|tara:strand:- start:725 stop:979 length:255 start_codon:yes stop_codon:yes gene_type:complete